MQPSALGSGEGPNASVQPSANEWHTAPGDQLWAARSAAGTLATALGVSPDGTRVFVTGHGYGGLNSDDYVTGAYDAETGTMVWGRRYNGPANSTDRATALVVSPDGSTVFVSGFSYGSASDGDYATVAYDAGSGATLWERRYNGPANGADFAAAVGVSADGTRVFVTGSTTGSGGNRDYATVAYSASTGAGLWARRYDGPAQSQDFPLTLRVSPDGSALFVSGHSDSSTGGDYATVGYDAATGASLWVRRYDGTASDYDQPTALGVSPDGSTVFVSGYSTGTMGSFDYATIAYDATTGMPVWVRRYDGPANDYDQPTALGVSPDGSTIFVSGYSTGTTGNFDYATIAYDATTGALRWRARFRRSGTTHNQAAALGVSPDGSEVYVTGFSWASTRDYATIAYDSTSGAALWGRLYDGPTNGHEDPTALGVSPDGSKMFVTGGSFASPGSDYATVAYSTS